MRVLRGEDAASLPWKNGLGVSRILLSSPDGAGYDSLDWQLSTTRIESNCPFSALPGLDRQFLLLEGAGVELACRDTESGAVVRRALNAPFEPFLFRGDWITECRLRAGPVAVFNVITRRGRALASVRSVEFEGRTQLVRSPGETLLAYVAGGVLRGMPSDAPVSAGDALCFDATANPTPGLETASADPVRLIVVRVRADRTPAGL